MPTKNTNSDGKKIRSASLVRKTKETQISMSLELDREKGGFCGSTGIGFFDHMLNSFAVHGGFAINLEMEGDLEVDG
ncbi:MAG: bifunctional histidinol-phosphatase/imidazoleglycerol-phosphate dehydratase, partial [Clostridiales bacterium]|nr:bifunctional histidinol-phosphatase/imidazoleglycerol-phosphate dehydratase [Clostridiales bacterium]